MAFVVETGAGVTDANAYIDVAFADGYHSDRGHENWEGTTVEKQAAIIRASEHIDKRFGPRFRGVRMSQRQGLEWPRLAAFDNDDFSLDSVDRVPRQLKKATAEYALRARRLGELNPDPPRPVPKQDNADPTQDSQVDVTVGIAQSKREKVGPIETEVSFRDSSSSSTAPDAGSSTVDGGFLPSYPAADLWIEELLSQQVARRIARG